MVGGDAQLQVLRQLRAYLPELSHGGLAELVVELEDFRGGEGHGAGETHGHFGQDFAGFFVGGAGQLTNRSGCCGSQ